MLQNKSLSVTRSCLFWVRAIYFNLLFNAPYWHLLHPKTAVTMQPQLESVRLNSPIQNFQHRPPPPTPPPTPPCVAIILSRLHSCASGILSSISFSLIATGQSDLVLSSQAVPIHTEIVALFPRPKKLSQFCYLYRHCLLYQSEFSVAETNSG